MYDDTKLLSATSPEQLSGATWANDRRAGGIPPAYIQPHDNVAD